MEFAYCAWNGIGIVERMERKGSYPEEESLVSHFIGAVCELVYW